MSHALMVAAVFPDIRAGRIAAAMKEHGWTHDVVARANPPQMRDAYEKIDVDWTRGERGLRDAIAEHPSPLVHVHGELHHMWPAITAKELGKTVVLNVHDLTIARPNSVPDPYEQASIEAADGLVWVTEGQRDFALNAGYDIDKPSCVVTNYVAKQFLLDKGCLPRIGGVVYEGIADKRGQDHNDRDLSAVADILDGQLHIYPGSEKPDYGIVHNPVLHYPILIQELARYDWGFAGHPKAPASWTHSMPTKITEYMAAGIPWIALNIPACEPLAKMGLGVCITDLEELPAVAKRDPKPYVRRVRYHRAEFTQEREVGPIADLYDELGG